MDAETVKAIKVMQEQINDLVQRMDETLHTFVNRKTTLIAGTFDDETAAKVQELYPSWNESETYKKGDRVRYQDTLYKCLQAHTAQSTWTPKDAPSLWAKVLNPSPTEIPEWVQPESTNPYMKNDKVKHNGKTWVSTVDNNVWEPGVYGWTEVTE